MAEHEAGPDLADPDKLDGGLAEIKAKLAGVQQQLGGDGMSEDQIKAMLEQSGVGSMPGMPPMPDADSASLPPLTIPQDPMERVEAAERKKEEGNDKFKKGDIADAKALYTQALRLVPAGHGAPKSEDEPDLRERAKACRIPVLLNLSLCCLKVEPCEAFRALELCEKVLDAEPDNVKATYRKAKALLELGELKEAEWEFKRGCKLAPKDTAMRKDLEALRARMKEHRDREKETYAAAFSKGPGFMSQGRGDEGDVASGQSKGAYVFLTDPSENPYRDESKPCDKALECEQAGRLEDAVHAWEVALSKSAEASDLLSHLSHWVDLARLFMDLNNDTLALRCINKVTEPEHRPCSAADVPTDAGAIRVRQHALLLRAICLLNEAERWEHANMKLASQQQYEERSVWARDSFDIHRPLQRQLDRPRPEKRWQINEHGNKSSARQKHEFARDAANSAWDMWRPVNYQPPPWAHNMHPRAAHAASSCMSASMNC